MMRLWMTVAASLLGAGCVGGTNLPSLREPGFETGADVFFEQEFRGCLQVSPEGGLSFEDGALTQTLQVLSECPDVPVQLVLDDPSEAFTVDPAGSIALSIGEPLEATLTLTRADGVRHEAQLIVRLRGQGVDFDHTVLQLTGQAGS